MFLIQLCEKFERTEVNFFFNKVTQKKGNYYSCGFPYPFQIFIIIVCPTILSKKKNDNYNKETQKKK